MSCKLRNYWPMEDASALKPMLESKGITLAALARDLGINKSTVTRWKRVPPDRLEAVAKITGISVNELRPDIPWNAAAPVGADAR